MYYIDGTRYDQVDGTGPVVPFTRTRPGYCQVSWYNPGRDQEYQVDGTDPVLPGVLVNGTTGLDTWSRLFW